MAARLTREESRAQTRERLLEAAEALFVERGVNGASVEQIAERAGFSRGAFYGNFEGRHELVLALLERRTERELREVSALSEGASSFAEVLERLREFHRRRAEHLEHWYAMRTELLLYALRNPETRPLLAEREYLARRALAEGVAAALSRFGAAPPADPAFLALIVHALEDGLLIQRLIAPEGVGDEVVVDAFELLLDTWAATKKETA